MFLGLAAQLVSPLLGAAVLAGVLPQLTVADLYWQPVTGGPWPLAARPVDGTAVGELTAGQAAGLLAARMHDLTGPLAGAFGRAFQLSGQVLRGNAGSALAGAAATLAAAVPAGQAWPRSWPRACWPGRHCAARGSSGRTGGSGGAAAACCTGCPGPGCAATASWPAWRPAVSGGEHRLLLFRREPAGQRRLAALPVPGQHVGRGDRAAGWQAGPRPGPWPGCAAATASAGGPAGRTCAGPGWHRHDVDLGAGRPRAGLDQPAQRDRLGRADRVERARAVVGHQLHDQAGQVTHVDDLDRLGRVGGHRHRPAARRPAHPVGEPVLPVVRPGHLPRPHDRGPVAVAGQHVVLAGDLQPAVVVPGQDLGVPPGRMRRGASSVGSGSASVCRYTAWLEMNRYRPARLAQRVHGLPDVPRHVAADVHHRVPAAVAQRRVVAGVPVAGQPGHAGEQAGPGPAAAEQGHLGPAAQRVLDDGPADERGPAQHKDPHDDRPYRGQ